MALHNSWLIKIILMAICVQLPLILTQTTLICSRIAWPPKIQNATLHGCSCSNTGQSKVGFYFQNFWLILLTVRKKIVWCPEHQTTLLFLLLVGSIPENVVKEKKKKRERDKIILILYGAKNSPSRKASRSIKAVTEQNWSSIQEVLLLAA